MGTKYIETDFNLDYTQADQPEDVLIKKIKDLSEKHNISFIEALEVIKHIEDNTCILGGISDALFEIEKSIRSLK